VIAPIEASWNNLKLRTARSAWNVLPSRDPNFLSFLPPRRFAPSRSSRDMLLGFRVNRFHGDVGEVGEVLTKIDSRVDPPAFRELDDTDRQSIRLGTYCGRDLMFEQLNKGRFH
jgi:hypothetical protein